MKNKKWFAGDLHQHSVFSSPLYGGDDNAPDSLEEIYKFMRSKGLSFGAASDHHNILNHEKWKQFETPEFIPIISKEISTGRGHVMALNASEDVIYSQLNQDDDSLRNEFIRVCEEIKRQGGVAQLNHPKDRKVSLCFPKRFYDLLPIFDTMEVWNGSEMMESGTKNGDAFELWISLLKRGVYIPATTGSDCHRIRENKVERYIKTVVLIEELNLRNILNAIKNGNSFLTSGPFVDIKINGKSYGETVSHNGDVLIEIDIKSDKPIDKLYIYDNINPRKEIQLNNTHYTTSLNYKSQGIRWLFFEVGSNPYNKAITNPIFLL